MRAALMSGCSLLPFDKATGVCARCGAELVGRQRRWCSEICRTEYERNHYWQYARNAALRRDKHRCVKCGWSRDFWDGGEYHQITGGQFVFWKREVLFKGDDPDVNWLEVDHIDPRVGRGYASDCGHHLENLRVLCHRCHVKVTRRQRIDRARAVA